METLYRGTFISTGRKFVLELTTCIIDDGFEMRYTTYGVRMLDADGESLLHYQDVSTDRAYVENFIQLCLDHDVSELHIGDLLEDYLVC